MALTLSSRDLEIAAVSDHPAALAFAADVNSARGAKMSHIGLEVEIIGNNHSAAAAKFVDQLNAASNNRPTIDIPAKDDIPVNEHSAPELQTALKELQTLDFSWQAPDKWQKLVVAQNQEQQSVNASYTR